MLAGDLDLNAPRLQSPVDDQTPSKTVAANSPFDRLYFCGGKCFTKFRTSSDAFFWIQLFFYFTPYHLFWFVD